MGLGNAFAGAAATAEDANTVWCNPAGLARLNFPQAEAAINVIIPSAKFQNANSQAALLQPLGGTGGDAGSAAFVPNLYASMAINDASTSASASTCRSASRPNTTTAGSAATRR